MAAAVAAQSHPKRAREATGVVALHIAVSLRVEAGVRSIGAVRLDRESHSSGWRGLRAMCSRPRILPPTSRLSANVALSVVSNFSRTFSTKNPQVYSLSVMLLSALRRINPPDSDALGRRVPIISLESTHSFIDALLTRTLAAWPARQPRRLP
jgi:hypothetical protein